VLKEEKRVCPEQDVGNPCRGGEKERGKSDGGKTSGPRETFKGGSGWEGGERGLQGTEPQGLAVSQEGGTEVLSTGGGDAKGSWGWEVGGKNDGTGKGKRERGGIRIRGKRNRVTTEEKTKEKKMPVRTRSKTKKRDQVSGGGPKEKKFGATRLKNGKMGLQKVKKGQKKETGETLLVPESVKKNTGGPNLPSTRCPVGVGVKC